MSLIFDESIPPTGNPEGILDGPNGTQFYKTGSFYSINYTGSWENVYFQQYKLGGYYLTNEDIAIMTVATGSFLYVKTTNVGNLNGWVLLSNKRISTSS